MIEWCSLNEYDLTLIEVMPMGDIGSENRFNQYLPLSKVKEKLSKTTSDFEKIHRFHKDFIYSSDEEITTFEKTFGNF